MTVPHAIYIAILMKKLAITKYKKIRRCLLYKNSYLEFLFLILLKPKYEMSAHMILTHINPNER